MILQPKFELVNLNVFLPENLKKLAKEKGFKATPTSKFINLHKWLLKEYNVNIWVEEVAKLPYDHQRLYKNFDYIHYILESFGLEVGSYGSSSAQEEYISGLTDYIKTL